jgi:hypothetical protein
MEKEAYKVGLKPTEFWTMTLREFYIYVESIIDTKQRENEQNDYRLATLMAHMHNLKATKKSKLLKAEDFLKKKRLKKDAKPQSANMMASMLKAFTLANGGDIKGG